MTTAEKAKLGVPPSADPPKEALGEAAGHTTAPQPGGSASAPGSVPRSTILHLLTLQWEEME